MDLLDINTRKKQLLIQSINDLIESSPPTTLVILVATQGTWKKPLHNFVITLIKESSSKVSLILSFLKDEIVAYGDEVDLFNLETHSSWTLVRDDIELDKIWSTIYESYFAFKRYSPFEKFYDIISIELKNSLEQVKIYKDGSYYEG